MIEVLSLDVYYFWPGFCLDPEQWSLYKCFHFLGTFVWYTDVVLATALKSWCYLSKHYPLRSLFRLTSILIKGRHLCKSGFTPFWKGSPLKKKNLLPILFGYTPFSEWPWCAKQNGRQESCLPCKTVKTLSSIVYPTPLRGRGILGNFSVIFDKGNNIVTSCLLSCMPIPFWLGKQILFF